MNPLTNTGVYNWGIGGLVGAGQASNTTTTGTQLQQYLQYPTPVQPSTYPLPYSSGNVTFVPVIDKGYTDKLHFRAADGSIHSRSVEELYRLIGLEW